MLKYSSSQQSNFSNEENDLLSDYLQTISKFDGNFSMPEHFALMNNQSQLTQLKEVQNKFTDYDFVIVVGIGGANLGIMTYAKAIDLPKPIYFFENIDPTQNISLIEEIKVRYKNGQRGLFFIASKSGSTTETMSNFAIVLKVFKEIEQDWKQRIISTTTEGSILDNIARTHGFEIVYVPELLADRFSVTGISTQLALALAGMDVEKTTKTLEDTNKNLLSTDFENNPALQYTANLWSNKNLSIVNYFIFSDRLRTYGYWQKQLFAESLGKNNKSQTPITSIGTTDLHSMTQLYLAGPTDKYTSFVTTVSTEIGLEMENIFEGTAISGLKNKKYSELLNLVETAVKTTYKKQKLIFDEIKLDSVSVEDLTYLLQFQMITIMLLGKLHNLDTFNQEAVELYKNEIRALI